MARTTADDKAHGLTDDEARTVAEDEGFRRVYDDGSGLLITLFSAGGKENRDLPFGSSYRAVTPMGLTLRQSPVPRHSCGSFVLSIAPDGPPFVQTSITSQS